MVGAVVMVGPLAYISLAEQVISGRNTFPL